MWLAQMGAHLPGSQGGSLTSLTDAGMTMGRDAQHASSEPHQPRSQEQAQSWWQGRAQSAAWPQGTGTPRPWSPSPGHHGLPQHRQASPVPVWWQPCPSLESWCAIPRPPLHHAASAEPAGGGGAWGSHVPSPPTPAHTPWLPAPAGIIKCAPVEHVLRLATGMWADLTYKPQQPGCNFQTGPVRSVFQLKIY